jgi:Methylase involved in ubiquinone/menaquinone biosynthesis
LQTGPWDNSKLDIVSDILSIPLPDHSVDAIMCTEVLEHIPDPLGAIKEFSRL